MVLNLKVLGIGLLVVFIAVFTLLFITGSLGNLRKQCGETNKNLKICKLNTLQVVVLMMLLIAGGLVVVVTVTGYILISGARSV